MAVIAGLIFFILGCAIIVYNVKDYERNDGDVYGGRIKLYGAAVILIMLGIVLVVRNISLAL